MKRAGVTQSELSRLAGVRPSSIAYWLQAKREPGLSPLCKLADALGVPLDQLRS
jgi:transcriptional regulator with XRE-family HTH domain